MHVLETQATTRRLVENAQAKNRHPSKGLGFHGPRKPIRQLSLAQCDELCVYNLSLVGTSGNVITACDNCNSPFLCGNPYLGAKLHLPSKFGRIPQPSIPQLKPGGTTTLPHLRLPKELFKSNRSGSLYSFPLRASILRLMAEPDLHILQPPARQGFDAIKIKEEQNAWVRLPRHLRPMPELTPVNPKSSQEIPPAPDFYSARYPFQQHVERKPLRRGFQVKHPVWGRRSKRPKPLFLLPTVSEEPEDSYEHYNMASMDADTP
eukprot:gb/GEZN01010461.1/.p1 GENE.gb/GEZN01010461.1/~~gb/GEZN01010461.1/.p1  ORF type:complete len:263 (-),score=16.60 gb/GEZN01010461.1/:327-1115(-)